MSHRIILRESRKPSLAAIRVLFGALLLLASSSSQMFAQVGPPATTEATDNDAFLQQQITDLSHPSYRARQLARWRLEQSPAASIRAIEKSIRSIDYNAASQLVDLLSSLAMHTDVSISLQEVQEENWKQEECKREREREKEQKRERVTDEK